MKAQQSSQGNREGDRDFRGDPGGRPGPFLVALATCAATALMIYTDNRLTSCCATPKMLSNASGA